MASKRSLYRPAQVQENVGQRRVRKTLAQGRLIGGTSQGVKAVTSTEALLITSHVSSVNHSELGQDGKSHVSQRNLNVVSGNQSMLDHSSVNQLPLDHSSQLQGLSGAGSLFTPQKTAPSFTENASVSFGNRAGSLDLSDTDPEGSQGDKDQRGYARYQQPSEVLCVDASRQTIDPDVSEVDIRIGIDRTPVKIVCHSPSTSKTEHRKVSGSVQKKEDEFDLFEESNLRRAFVRKEKSAGSQIDPYTAVQSIPMSPVNAEEDVLQSLPQPNFSESLDSDRQDSSRDMDDDDKCSVQSADMCSLNEYVTKTGKTTKKQKSVSAQFKDESQTRPTTDKKKKGRIVPSRYMQAMETKAKTSLTSRMDKTSDKSSMRKTVAGRSMEAPPSARKTAAKKNTAMKTVDRPSTPDNSMTSSQGGKTSTPTMENSVSLDEFDIDASAIHAESSMIAGGDLSRLHHSNVSTKGRTRSRLQRDVREQEKLGQSILSNVSTLSSKPKHKKPDLKKLDLLRVYNLQWAFLEAKARKTLRDQEKQAMIQLFGLHEICEKIRKANIDKKQQLSRLQHTNMTDNLTEIQRQCLGPVVTCLPILQKQYQALAEALDTTRHQIPTKDIFLPENEDQYQSMLESQMLKSELVLAEIRALSGGQMGNVTVTANSIVAMEKAVEEMKEELQRNGELLAATESLAMHECSLRVQELQILDSPAAV